MPKLVTKFKYLKPKCKQSVGQYAKYIATREGVEKLDASQKYALATAQQKKLICKLMQDFPDCQDMLEYFDYRQSKTAAAASDLIQRALEEHTNEVVGRKGYAKYIATRPRAERFGSHGLFTDDGIQVQLSKVAEELDHYQGNVWTIIISLRREDAERLGFSSGARWRDMLRSQTAALAEQLKIPLEHLRWYGAFHNESHHPHVHLIVFSSVEGEGFLSRRGVENLRSALARDIFTQDLVSVYEKQTEHRDSLRSVSRERVAKLVAQIGAGDQSQSGLEELLSQLARRLSHTSGKKAYGYLKADVKAIADDIVDELAREPNIAQLYDLWYEQREAVLRTYTDTMPPRMPLSQNREFKAIRNAVIQEALHLRDLSNDTTSTSVTEYAFTATDFNLPIASSTLRLLGVAGQMLQSHIQPADAGQDAAPRRIDHKEWRRILEKKEAQGLHME